MAGEPSSDEASITITMEDNADNVIDIQNTIGPILIVKLGNYSFFLSKLHEKSICDTLDVGTAPRLIKANHLVRKVHKLKNKQSTVFTTHSLSQHQNKEKRWQGSSGNTNDIVLMFHRSFVVGKN